ncbi:MAG: hypothetical protein H7Y04_09270 [Verrucomicrobia bacterium]|nr:hypothetical protein [Cytophagales bacterium]
MDIFHEKATMIPPTVDGIYSYNSQIVLENEFEGFNVPFNHFRKYIQEVDYKIEVETIFIVEEEKYLQETKTWSNQLETNYTVLHNPDKKILDLAIKNYEQERKLGDLQFTIQPANEFRHYHIQEYYYTVKRKGFYVKEVGYQRKGVNYNFWNRFEHEDTYNFAWWEDFEYAYDCVDKYWSSDTKQEIVQRKADFKKDFLDNFELGASYMRVSY